MIRVGIIGASGYGGAELTRYLLAHPHVEITYLASGTLAGKPLSDAFPAFLGRKLPLCEPFDARTAITKADFFFHARANGMCAAIAPELLGSGKKLIDLTADFRLRDRALHEQYYGPTASAPDLESEAVYGIPELHASDIAGARLIANPGCYATGAILALAPLAAAGLIEPGSVVIDSKSGVSGAGRSKLDLASLFCEVNEGIKAYAVTSHRHTPEIEQELTSLAGTPVVISFTPHLTPMNRGILTTAYAKLGAKEPGKHPEPVEGRFLTTTALLSLYNDFYSDAPFVRILGQDRQPNPKNVDGTNFCHIAAVMDARTGRAIITSAIDNMGKGAAGQAVQNMNLMCSLEQTTGLLATAVYP